MLNKYLLSILKNYGFIKIQKNSFLKQWNLLSNSGVKRKKYHFDTPLFLPGLKLNVTKIFLAMIFGYVVTLAEWVQKCTILSSD